MEEQKDFTQLSDGEKLTQIWLESIATNALLHAQLVAQARLLAHFIGSPTETVRAELMESANHEYQRQVGHLRGGSLRTDMEELA